MRHGQPRSLPQPNPPPMNRPRQESRHHHLVSPEQLARAIRHRAEGVTLVDLARRLGVGVNHLGKMMKGATDV